MSIVYSPYSFTKETYFVYAMLCRDGDGPLYVKFGRSRSIGNRLSALRTGSPIPARWFAIMEVPGPTAQSRVETGLHKHFQSRRTTGEWFRFESDDESEKRAFNDGCTKVFKEKLGNCSGWQKLSVKALDEFVRRERLALLNAAGKKKIEAINRAKKAQRELASYGR